MPYIVRGMFRKHKDQLGRGLLSVPQFLSLDLIDRNKAIPMKDIAKELNVSLPAATGIVERLYKLGLVKRIADSQDRRIIKIILTPKGERVLENTRRARREAVEEAFSSLTNKERKIYLEILKKVKDNIYGK